MDLAGASGLVGFAVLLAGNQVVIKLTNAGISPVFAAGVRSALAAIVVLGWILLRRRTALAELRAMAVSGMVLGLLFAVEFVLLFVALDLTTVSRASIVFYTMPVWLALMAHFVLPQERLTPLRCAGLVLAVAGVAWALSDPHSRGAGDWHGDLLALAASLTWTGIALVLRMTRASDMTVEAQLIWQLVVSAVLLVPLAPLFGPVLRRPEAWHWGGIVFQGVVVVGAGFMLWLALLKRYRASDVASFSFLTPVLAVAMGWALLDEPVGWSFLGALGLVAAGIVLINRR